MTLDPSALTAHGIMRGVDLRGIESLLSRCEQLRLAPEDILIAAGSANQRMYLVLEGRLGVHLGTPQSPEIASLTVGDSVGELSLLDHRPASAYVVAATSTLVLPIEEDVFWALVRNSHRFSVNLLTMLASRVRDNNASLYESEALRAQFEREALVDGLTGIHNRRWLDNALPRLVRRSAYDKSPLTVLLMDVDHFKRFNDEHGHAAGDAVLKEVGQSLCTGMRPTDLTARYGGEEFVAILPNTSAIDAVNVAERMRKRVAGTRVMGPTGELPRVSISVGLAELDRRDDAASLLAAADQALYRAKAKGRDRVEVASRGRVSTPAA